MKSEKNKNIILISFFFIVLIWFFIESRLKVNDINDNEIISVCRVTKISSLYYSNSAHYIFFYNNKTYKSFINIKESKEEAEEMFLKKYYLVRFSSSSPENSEIDLKKQIFDTAEIKKAGFKLN